MEISNSLMICQWLIMVLQARKARERIFEDELKHG